MRLFLLVLILCSRGVASDFVITNGPVAGPPTGPPVVAWDDPDEAVPPKSNVTQDVDEFLFFGAAGCDPCRRMKLNVLPTLLAAGFTVQEVPAASHASMGVGPIPEIRRLRNGVVTHRWVGYTQAAVLLSGAKSGKEAAQPVQTQQAKTVLVPVPKNQPQRYIHWPGWAQTIDLETYSNNSCRCPMCNGIRAMQAEYWRQKNQPVQYQTVTQAVPQPVATAVSTTSVPTAAQQQPTPAETLQQLVKAMPLKAADVLADLGCGDGRILVAFVQAYNCTGIGVEIDPDKAVEARKVVTDAGLAHKITIITGDARDFDPAAHNVTAITAYLYPELLRALGPKFKMVQYAATPFHKVPDLPMVPKGDIWVYTKQAAIQTAPVTIMSAPQSVQYLPPTQRAAPVMYSTSMSRTIRSGASCSNGRCGNGRCSNGRCR